MSSADTVIDEDVQALAQRIAAIEDDLWRPPAPGETRSMSTVANELSADDWSRASRIVRSLSRDHLAALNLFAGEIGLTRAVVDALTTRPLQLPWPEPRELPVTLGGLAEYIVNEARTGKWAVVVPLANLRVSEPVLRLDDECWLAHADAVLDPNEHDDDARRARQSLRRELGIPITVRERWVRLESPVDSRLGAALVLVTRGTSGLAEYTAKAQAGYLLAAWTLLAAPGDSVAWPSVTYLGPQPYLEFQHAMHAYARDDEDPERSTKRHGSIQSYREYSPPADLSLLRRPLAALRRADASHGAACLLSATWAWHMASRRDAPLNLTDKLLNACTAIHALCEPNDPKQRFQGRSWGRWKTLVPRIPHLTERAHAFGYSAEDIEDIRTRLKQVRNLAAHGGDSVLVNLGWPPGRGRHLEQNRRHMTPGDELSVARMHATLRPSLWLVREALLHCWSIAAEADFADDALEPVFQSG